MARPRSVQMSAPRMNVAPASTPENEEVETRMGASGRDGASRERTSATTSSTALGSSTPGSRTRQDHMQVKQQNRTVEKEKPAHRIREKTKLSQLGLTERV